MVEGMDKGGQDGLEILFAGLQVQDEERRAMNPDVFNADLRDWYEERAAFLEYCEGLNRETAERLAFAQTALKKRANL
tara:strand:+ start:1455 stop:1688 length:234 start_codon:yes stop_codon:yes gene_type:complete